MGFFEGFLNSKSCGLWCGWGLCCSGLISEVHQCFLNFWLRDIPPVFGDYGLCGWLFFVCIWFVFLDGM